MTGNFKVRSWIVLQWLPSLKNRVPEMDNVTCKQDFDEGIIRFLWNHKYGRYMKIYTYIFYLFWHKTDITTHKKYHENTQMGNQVTVKTEYVHDETALSQAKYNLWCKTNTIFHNGTDEMSFTASSSDPRNILNCC